MGGPAALSRSERPVEICFPEDWSPPDHPHEWVSDEGYIAVLFTVDERVENAWYFDVRHRTTFWTWLSANFRGASLMRTQGQPFSALFR